MKKILSSSLDNTDTDQLESVDPQEELELEVPQINTSLEYLLNNSQQEATIQLYKEYLHIVPTRGKEFEIKYRNILRIKGENYKISIILLTLDELTLSCLGYSYEDFLRILMMNRNELILRDMLYGESKIFLETEGEYKLSDEAYITIAEGEAIVRLYETGLLVIPANSELFRIPYSLINRVEEEGYKLHLLTDISETLTLTKMGYGFEGFKKFYSELTGKLNNKLSKAINELFPNVMGTLILKLTSIMGEGKAIKKETMDSISPELWTLMENKLQELNLVQEYNFLKSMSQQNKISIGLKKGLMGKLTEEYILLMFPIYNITPKYPGNLIALEALSTHGEGRATYFFRIMAEDEYSSLNSFDQLNNRVDKLLKLINYCMLQINFRREPIYLTKEQLLTPQYEKYLYSIENQPALKILREHFIGRVLHTNYEDWCKKTLEIIHSNK